MSRRALALTLLAALACGHSAPASAPTPATAAAAAPAPPLFAKGGVPSAAMARIAELERDSSQLEPLAQALFDSLGPRLTGSPGLRSAQQWVIARYAAWGIGAKVVEYGTWRSWQRGPTHLDLIAPRVRSLEAMMLAWSPGTNGVPVDGDVVVLPAFTSAEQFHAWLPSAAGKFVLVTTAPPSCRPDTSWAGQALPGELDRVKAARVQADSDWARSLRAAGVTARDLPDSLEKAGAAGALRNLWSGGWGVDRIFSARTKRMPVVDVSCEDYGLLFRLASRGQHPRARLASSSTEEGEVPVGNVIAEIPGGAQKDQYVMLSAHFDSWDGSSGATDNGTGTIVMMEAMRILRTVLPHPRRTILAGHWSGEEEGLVGSHAFEADMPQVTANLQALFNQDNGTGRVQAISMQGLTGALPFFQRWFSAMPDTLVNAIRLVSPGEPGRGGTDNASFICAGAPAFGLNSVNWDYFTYTWHTNRDTYDKVVFDEIRRNAALVAMLAYQASEDTATVPRTRVAELKNARTGKVEEWPTCAAPLRKSSEYQR